MEPIGGIVYVLSHPRMPGLLKIGCTSRTTDERIAELSSPTGVPGRYELEAEFHVRNEESSEKAIHTLLATYNTEKEFFQIGLAEALDLISDAFGYPDYIKTPLKKVPKRSENRLLMESGRSPVNETSDGNVKAKPLVIPKPAEPTPSFGFGSDRYRV